jgi:hypothetical protein
MVTADFFTPSDCFRSAAYTGEFQRPREDAEPGGAANQSQPIDPEANQTSGAAPIRCILIVAAFAHITTL